MEYSDVLKHLSPCGLDCVRCADYEQGEIKQLSSRLIQLLGNYKPVAKMKTEKQPIFNDYPQFNEILKSFANGICSGCRGENVQCPIKYPRIFHLPNSKLTGGRGLVQLQRSLVNLSFFTVTGTASRSNLVSVQEFFLRRRRRMPFNA